MDVILVPESAGEVLDSRSGVRILEDGSNTEHRIGVMVDSLPPGSGGPPQHIHRKHSETFYVVSWTMRFTSGSEHVDVSPRGLVTAPIGVPHTFSNPWRVGDLHMHGGPRPLHRLLPRTGRPQVATRRRGRTEREHHPPGDGPLCHRALRAARLVGTAGRATARSPLAGQPAAPSLNTPGSHHIGG